ncbi:hypothetical protein AHAS_Ahas03G0115200 [Arachis hypogaea]
MNQSLSRLETMLERYEREAQRSWNDQEKSFKNMKVLVNQMLSVKEEVEEQEEEMTRKHENSQPSQTSLNQRCSTLESVIEKYEEEIKKSWEEQQTSSMKVLLSQMLSVKEEVKEQESEEDNQGSSYSSEVENYIDEGFIEPPIQKTFDEDNVPTTTQPPSTDIQEVKATSKSTNPTLIQQASSIKPLTKGSLLKRGQDRGH